MGHGCPTSIVGRRLVIVTCLLVLCVAPHVADGAGIAAAPVDGSTDYYELLGVPRTATAKDIKRAYRHKSIEVHPDKHPPGEKDKWEAAFVVLVNAYKVLSDEDQRALYDKGQLEGTPTFRDFGSAYQAHRSFDIEDRPLNWAAVTIVTLVSCAPIFAVALRRRARKASTRGALLEKRARDERRSARAAQRQARKDEDGADSAAEPVAAGENETSPSARDGKPAAHAHAESSQRTATAPQGSTRAKSECYDDQANGNGATTATVVRKTTARKPADVVDASPPRPWTADELKLLTKALKKYPAGVKRRWDVVASAVRTRTRQEVLKQVSRLRRTVARGAGSGAETATPASALTPAPAPAPGGDQKGNRQRAASSTTQSQPKDSTSASAGVGAPAADASAGEQPWAAAEQQQLEEAMRDLLARQRAGEITLTQAERWKAISERVPGRTARECLARFRLCRAKARAAANAADSK